MNNTHVQQKTVSAKSYIENNSLLTIHGEDDIISKLSDMIQNAKNKIIIVCPLNDLSYIQKTPLFDVISSATKRGVPIHIVTEKATSKQLESLPKIDVTEIKFGYLFSTTVTIIEQNTCLLLSSTFSKNNIMKNQKTALFTYSAYAIEDIFTLCELLLNKSSYIPNKSTIN